MQLLLSQYGNFSKYEVFYFIPKLSSFCLNFGHYGASSLQRECMVFFHFDPIHIKRDIAVDVPFILRMAIVDLFFVATQHLKDLLRIL